ncbi:hypothetical protein [Microbacterium sp. MMO-10]|uniref:hypothetical protein n=1 Tax=Microbacterium sp. MMO-10 TaxID=3081272 RepID=UPI0030180E3A
MDPEDSAAAGSGDPRPAGRGAPAVTRLSTPLRIVLGLALVGVGAVFLLVSMTVQTIARRRHRDPARGCRGAGHPR